MTGPTNELAKKRAAVNRTLSERMDFLEQKVEAGLDDVRNTVKTLVELIDGLVHSLNTPTASQKLGEGFSKHLSDSITHNRLKAETERVESETKQIETLVTNGKLALVENVTSDALLVLRKYDKDGNVVHPGRMHLETAQIIPTVQAELMGKPVGTIIPVGETGEKLEVLAVYAPVKEVKEDVSPALPA